MTSPDQIPESFESLRGISATSPLVYVPKETGAGVVQHTQDLDCLGVQLGIGVGSFPERGERVAWIERNPSITGAKRALSHPDEVSGHHESIDAVSGLGNSGRQHVSLENRGRHGGTGQPENGI